jgi:hypothetical protein
VAKVNGEQTTMQWIVTNNIAISPGGMTVVIYIYIYIFGIGFGFGIRIEFRFRLRFRFVSFLFFFWFQKGDFASLFFLSSSVE